MSSNSEGMGLA